MKRVRQLGGAATGNVYRVQVPAARPATDYTPHIVARRAAARIPLEAPFSLWQR